jgi:hypothetical protein
MQASTELRPVVAAPRRLLILAAGFVIAAVIAWSLQAGQSIPPGAPTSRWPTDNGFYAVPGWNVSGPNIEAANGNTYVTRRFERTDDGSQLTFILTTSQNVKTVYRAGPDVPFLGSGYESVPVSADLTRIAHQSGVSQVRRGDEGWLQVYAYGERRGLNGNGAVGWALAVFDSVLGQPKDYYLLRVLVPTGNNAPDAIKRASDVADVLFPRVADWYAR